MKVLKIDQSDRVGGAAIAEYCLHRDLLSSELKSRSLLDKVSTNNDCATQEYPLEFQVR